MECDLEFCLDYFVNIDTCKCVWIVYWSERFSTEKRNVILILLFVIWKQRNF